MAMSLKVKFMMNQLLLQRFLMMHRSSMWMTNLIISSRCLANKLDLKCLKLGDWECEHICAHNEELSRSTREIRLCISPRFGHKLNYELISKRKSKRRNNLITHKLERAKGRKLFKLHHHIRRRKLLRINPDFSMDSLGSRKGIVLNIFLG
uniref:Uncharacterized protein n=1 Tax=Lactuca sativa TaxID=4236 RepID=A0A9R1WS83_LACSA|nr:hypothetical protein LSAT_V11C900487070 [Lactuca sativa]